MHPVLLYILAYLGASAIGVISAVTIFGICWLTNRFVETRIESAFLILGLIGLTLALTGQFLDNRLLVAASLVLWGWTVLPILILPPFLLWQLVAWLFRRTTTK
jgi:hypothetical protein